MQWAITCFAELPIPVIAAVHGYCIGGGIDLITGCDIRVASADAIFSVRETKMAIVADLGTLQRLPRLVGPGVASELAFTGRDFDATYAEKVGLVNRLSAPGAAAVYESANSLAQEIAANPPLAVSGTKAVLAANDGKTIDEGLQFVANWNSLYLRSNDLTEAMTAFLEKRSPRFAGN
jgi:enoyl-CoA hydratase